MKTPRSDTLFARLWAINRLQFLNGMSAAVQVLGSVAVINLMTEGEYAMWVYAQTFMAFAAVLGDFTDANNLASRIGPLAAVGKTEEVRGEIGAYLKMALILKCLMLLIALSGVIVYLSNVWFASTLPGIAVIWLVAERLVAVPIHTVSVLFQVTRRFDAFGAMMLVHGLLRAACGVAAITIMRDATAVELSFGYFIGTLAAAVVIVGYARMREELRSFISLRPMFAAPLADVRRIFYVFYLRTGIAKKITGLFEWLPYAVFPQCGARPETIAMLRYAQQYVNWGRHAVMPVVDYFHGHFGNVWATSRIRRVRRIVFGSSLLIWTLVGIGAALQIAVAPWLAPILIRGGRTMVGTPQSIVFYLPWIAPSMVLLMGASFMGIGLRVSGRVTEQMISNVVAAAGSVIPIYLFAQLGDWHIAGLSFAVPIAIVIVCQIFIFMRIVRSEDDEAAAILRVLYVSGPGAPDEPEWFRRIDAKRVAPNTLVLVNAAPFPRRLAVTLDMLYRAWLSDVVVADADVIPAGLTRRLLGAVSDKLILAGPARADVPYGGAVAAKDADAVIDEIAGLLAPDRACAPK